MSINWFPGHMHKARKEIAEVMPQVDVIIEMIDARIPFSSENPLVPELRGDTPCIKVLNKADLADPAVTASWQAQGKMVPARHGHGAVRGFGGFFQLVAAQVVSVGASKPVQGRCCAGVCHSGCGVYCRGLFIAAFGAAPHRTDSAVITCFGLAVGATLGERRTEGTGGIHVESSGAPSQQAGCELGVSAAT